jgi:hypothetical protein
MRTIGIRELKAQLSKVLRDVQAGDVVLVTDRGRVVAEMRRPDAPTWSASPHERAIARLAATGQVRIGERPAGAHGVYQESPLSSPAGTAQSLLDADRGEE